MAGSFLPGSQFGVDFTGDFGQLSLQILDLARIGFCCRQLVDLAADGSDGLVELRGITGHREAR